MQNIVIGESQSLTNYLQSQSLTNSQKNKQRQIEQEMVKKGTGNQYKEEGSIPTPVYKEILQQYYNSFPDEDTKNDFYLWMNYSPETGESELTKAVKTLDWDKDLIGPARSQFTVKFMCI